MSKIKFHVGEYYHIYNRGVEKRDIFLDNSDHFRFLSNLKELNVCNSDSVVDPQEVDPLTAIVCYCLMPNHFHLIVQQLRENGISKFMQRVGTAYTMYFNKKYNRSGVLFQSGFKAKHIENNQYLLHLSRYIHLNPSDLLVREDDLESQQGSLIKYKWSSLPFYLDEKRPCLIKLKKKIILDQVGNIEEFKSFLFSLPTSTPSLLEDLKIEEYLSRSDLGSTLSRFDLG